MTSFAIENQLTTTSNNIQHHKILNGFDIRKIIALYNVCTVYVNMYSLRTMYIVHMLSFNSLKMHESNRKAAETEERRF